MRFSNWQLLSVMESYPILITLIKTFNFWLFLPVTDRLFCVLSLVHSYSRAQVARWLLPRLVWPLRRVYSRYTGYTAQSCPDTTPVNICTHTQPVHTLQLNNVDEDFFHFIILYFPFIIKSILHKTLNFKCHLSACHVNVPTSVTVLLSNK